MKECNNLVYQHEMTDAKSRRKRYDTCDDVAV